MRITTDSFPIYLAFACTAVALIGYVVSALMRDSNPKLVLSTIARRAYLVSVACVGYTTLYLLQAILSQTRYDIDYIYQYSGPGDEMIYRVSSLWAGQEGSLLFWTMLIGIIGAVLIWKWKSESHAALAFWCSLQLSLIMVLLAKSPFVRVEDFQPGMVGTGLNPLLKNPWMAIHPPVLFVGYAALAVPAAAAIQGLIEGDLTRWAKRCLPWAVLGWVLLGSGIFLGMVWAYEVIGWGGFWGWDLVENASLIPWLASTALLHGLIVQRYRGRMAWPNVILALSTFMLVLYATFLTRSGVLGELSKHSFVGLGTYNWLFGILMFFLSVCVVTVILRMRAAKPTAGPLVLSKDFALVAGAVTLVLYAAVVLAGTSAPLFTKDMVAQEFYNRMSVPVALLGAIFIVLASVLGWSRADGRASAVRFDKSLWKSGSHIAHLGVLIAIVGIVASCMGGSKRVVLPRNGSGESALGYTFTYTGTTQIATDKQKVNVTAKRGNVTRDTPILIKASPNGALTLPYIIYTPLGDLYISPGDQPVEWPTAKPKVRFVNGDWQAEPTPIPDTDASVTLTGIRVEDRQVKVMYEAPGKKPVELTVNENKPTEIDGYHLTFDGFEQDEMHKMGDSVTARISVTGNGLVDRAIIQVSWKPLISLVWLGLTLVVIGGFMACWRRFREKRTVDDGILPDSL